jgi:hypothetical protein
MPAGPCDRPPTLTRVLKYSQPPGKETCLLSFCHRAATLEKAKALNREQDRQLAPGGLRFFSASASVIIIIIGSTGHS